MIGVIQRVKSASVSIDSELYSEIGQGILLLLGVEKGDTKDNVEKSITLTSGCRVVWRAIRLYSSMVDICTMFFMVTGHWRANVSISVHPE